ncbi:complement decay-accelerating factor isoform X2 [Lemur catta]|uniref:complement decay-accelerating factor isoform X2 n=1 Tax=Lemur catta TaxID=9447 RepID=UPI001E2684CA|nr:complement decay-accelerating factor isoform X2 [Lemur catta]
MSLARPSAPTVPRLLGSLCLLLLWPPATRGDCGPPSEVPNAHADLRGLSSFPVNSTVTYRCNEGFVKVLGQTDSVICLENDQWSEISEFCNRSCDFPPQLHFAMLKRPYSTQNYFPAESTVEYECRLGYKRVFGLSRTLTCLQNFKWSEPADFCTKKSCTNPGELLNGHINVTTDFLFGATIYFSCNTGYKLVGAEFSHCIIVGDDVGWTDPLPLCTEIHCQKPPEIENGRIIGGERDIYVYNQAVMYACNRGLTLIGKDTIHCTARGDEGEWSDPPPQCRGRSPPATFPPPDPKPTTAKVPGTSTSHKPTTVPGTKVTPTSRKPSKAPATQGELLPRTTKRSHTTTVPKGGKIPSDSSSIIAGILAGILIVSTLSLGIGLWKLRAYHRRCRVTVGASDVRSGKL